MGLGLRGIPVLEKYRYLIIRTVQYHDFAHFGTRYSAVHRYVAVRYLN